jgi:hypothetical protein
MSNELSTPDIPDADDMELALNPLMSFEEWQQQEENHRANVEADEDDNIGYLSGHEEALEKALAQQRRALEMIADGHRLLAEVMGPKGAYRRHMEGLDRRERELPTSQNRGRPPNRYIDYVIYKEKWLRDHGRIGIRRGDISEFWKTAVNEAPDRRRRVEGKELAGLVDDLQRQVRKRKRDMAWLN